MRILALCRVLDVDRTSEGICSRNFLRVLYGLGHEVFVLTGAPTDYEPESVRSGAHLGVGTISPAGMLHSLNSIRSRVAESAPIARWLLSKGDAVVAFGSGWNVPCWAEVAAWNKAIQAELARRSYDVVYARGSGSRFDPHIAMAQIRPIVPWIAHYHDPFPVSLYPEPYRVRRPLLSSRQERWHYRILERATGLTFTSERLRGWVLKGALERHRMKAFVVPHTAILEQNSSPEGDSLRREFRIVHTGSLLGPRDPGPLVDAFSRFIEHFPEAGNVARLSFVGRARPQHRSKNWWRIAHSHCNIEVHDRRLEYKDARKLAQAAAACVVLEADAAESPFLPGKLADYLALRRPILALSPRQSAVADILGSEYPLLACPSDRDGIGDRLALLWNHWKGGTLDRLVPALSATEELGEGTVRQRLSEALENATRRQVA